MGSGHITIKLCRQKSIFLVCFAGHILLLYLMYLSPVSQKILLQEHLMDNLCLTRLSKYGMWVTLVFSVLHDLANRYGTSVSQICSTFHKYFPVFSSFMTYHRISNNSNTTGATNGAGTAYPSGAPEFIPSFSGVRVARSLVFYV